MMPLLLRIGMTCAALCALAGAVEGDAPLRLGQDTVLVWKAINPYQETTFVARIARFAPDRFLEWEDGKSQGTVFMPEKEVLGAKGYDSSSLFGAGMDKTARNSTTLWLSRRIFRELKEKHKANCVLDGVPGRLRLAGLAELEVTVNGATTRMRVVRVSDERGGERWFLDDEENPLLLRYAVRDYEQKLVGITTDRENTLRWIKGKKLTDRSP